MPTRTPLTIYEGTTFSQALTVTSDATTKTYSAVLVDRWRRKIVDMTVTTDTETQVTISLTKTQVDNICIPAGIRLDQEYGLLGYYELKEVDGSDTNRPHYGPVTINRDAERE